MRRVPSKHRPVRTNRTKIRTHMVGKRTKLSWKRSKNSDMVDLFVFAPHFAKAVSQTAAAEDSIKAFGEFQLSKRLKITILPNVMQINWYVFTLACQNSFIKRIKPNLRNSWFEFIVAPHRPYCTYRMNWKISTTIRVSWSTLYHLMVSNKVTDSDGLSSTPAAGNVQRHLVRNSLYVFSIIAH